MNFLYDLLLLGIAAFLSWAVTHVYYKKSLTEQEREFMTERTALIQALEQANSMDTEIVTQQRIDQAVSAWKQTGTPIHYLNSLTDVSNEEKAKIFRAASLRHKKREPKNNPYDLSDEPQ